MRLWYVDLLRCHSPVLPDDNYSLFELGYDSTAVDLVLGKIVDTHCEGFACSSYDGLVAAGA